MRKRHLTKDKICQVALELVEAAGLENLSMRKVAEHLNVEAASLYNHIASKSELFDLIQEHLYSQLPTDFSKKDWKKHLIDVATVTRYGLLQFPKAALLFATRPTLTSSSLKQADMTLSILLQAGFKKSDVLAIYRNLHVFILGHVLAEVGLVPGEKDDQNDPSFQKIKLDEYPFLKKTMSLQQSHDFEKGFKLGLQCMIHGLENLLRR